ncbi:hypothetical protein [Alicyclobacillus mengziensis]|uniref:DUF4268 domain-containing protein n=1 Tax=Alicyclobacillus mengziensis TaxID=2931921 RepID=A0A9X7W158_9BACL|nr:hypothetical protein [Alicyclobacillus mengziensis]QSO48475.1 hypothetical protein JZ786_05655 [Alicyclobacillus mengziensis]
MSLKGSEREFIFSLYMRQRQQIIEDVLGFTLTDLLLEKYWDKLKIDLFGYEKNLGVPVMIEVWLGISNGYHQDRFIELIDMLDEGTILVYLALGFQDKHIVELEKRVRGCDKPIKLILVNISDRVLKPLELLNTKHKLKIYGELAILDEIEKPLQLMKVIEHSLFKALSPKPLPDYHEFDFSRRVDINRYLLLRLREAVPNFLPVQREKRFYESNATIRLSGGKSGVDYFVSARNRRNQAFVELRFDDSNRELFQLFTSKPWLLREQIDERIKIGNNAIGCYFRASENVKVTADELVKVFSRMVRAISYPLFDILKFEYQMV